MARQYQNGRERELTPSYIARDRLELKQFHDVASASEVMHCVSFIAALITAGTARFLCDEAAVHDDMTGTSFMPY
jgi:hypothetical protein